MIVRGSSALLVVSLFAVEVAFGQRSSSWRSYKLADGLPESSCISVRQAGQGKILVRHFHLPLVSELDGYRVRVLPAAEETASRVYASPGGQLWTAVPQGLQELRDSGWLLHPIAEIEAAYRYNTSPIDPVPLYPVRQGQVIFLLPDRLMKLSLENPDRSNIELLRTVAQSQLQKFSALIPARNGGIWVGGARGLAKADGPARNIRPESPWSEFIVPGSLNTRDFVELHEDEDGGVTALGSSTNDQRVIVHFDGRRWD